MTAREPLRLPPHSIEAEQSLLGGLLLDNSAWSRIAGQVSEADFYRDDHRRIFRHIAKLIEAARPADVVTVYESLEKSAEAEQAGGMAYLGEIANNTPSAANIKRYAEIVRERAILRMLQAVAREADTLAGLPGNLKAAEIVASVEARLGQVRERIGGPESRFTLLSPEEIFASMQPAADLVAGVFPSRGIVGVIGASMSGKGFLLVDLMPVIAEGGIWFSRKVEAANVTYVCLEGAAGLPKRFRGWEKHHGRAYPRIAVIVDSVDLRDSEQTAALIAAIRAAGRHGGVVVIDTMAQAAPGMDENSSSDMGILLAALQKLQRELDALVVVVHHLGKNAERGPRGHSSFLAALDACIEVRREGDRRSWIVTKAKDDLDGVEHEFRLKVVKLDAVGDQTSCVVESVAAPAAAVRRALPPKSGNQAVIWSALGELFRKAGDARPDGAPDVLPRGRPCLSIEAAVAQTRTRLICDTKRQTERAQSAITGLIGRGLLESRDGFIWCR